MSLLLKALKSAEQTREKIRVEPNPQGSELHLEPIEAPERQAAAQPSAAYRPEQAESVLRAKASYGIVDFAQDHAFGLTVGALLLIMVGWAVYVYISVQQPAWLSATRAVAPSPSASPHPVLPPINDPAPEPLAGSAPTAQAAVPVASVPSAESPSSAPAVGEPTSDVVKLMEQRSPPAPVNKERPEKAKPQPRPNERRSASAQELQLKRSNTEPKIDPLLLRAYQAFRESRPDEAKSLYLEFLQREPQNVDAPLGLAAIYALEGQAEKAIQSYFRVLELDPKNPIAQAGLIGLVGQADPAGSETRLKTLISREPSAFLYFTLGNLYADQQQWAPAQAAYFQAHHLAAENADYAYNLAVSLEHINQPRPALLFYRKALALGEATPRIHFDVRVARARVEQLQVLE
jgi:tetratricopeptide (TPR) repeat protein